MLKRLYLGGDFCDETLILRMAFMFFQMETFIDRWLWRKCDIRLHAKPTKKCVVECVVNETCICVGWKIISKKCIWTCIIQISMLTLHTQTQDRWCHSSDGRAKDWKSLCPRFDSWWHHNFECQLLNNQVAGIFFLLLPRRFATTLPHPHTYKTWKCFLQCFNRNDYSGCNLLQVQIAENRRVTPED